MQFDESYEVIVAGTGAAGGGAVMGALMGGAKKVLVCEKSADQVGGTTQNAGLGWMWIPNNRFLKAMGVKQSPEEIVELLVDLAQKSSEGHKVDEGDLELMKAFAHEWPEIATVIEKKGFFKFKQEFVRSDEDAEKLLGLYEEKLKRFPKECAENGITRETVETLKTLMPSYCAENDLDKCPTGKVLSCDGKGTSGFVQTAIANNDQIVTLKEGFQIVDLIFESDARVKVIGAVVKDVENGKEFKFEATKGVIFGSGGFAMNESMLKKYFDCEFHGTCAGEANTGDLVDISIKNGIKLYGMDEAWVKQVVVPHSDATFPGVFFHNADSYVVVNRYGKRFADERDFYQHRGRRMIENQKEMKVVFGIFDKRSGELYAGPLASLGGPIPFEFAQEDCVVEGKTFEELSENIKKHLKQHVSVFELDSNFASTLKAEVLKFNEFAKTGDDKDFGRGKVASKFCWQTGRRENDYPCKTMHPIDTSNLRALVLGLSTLDTRGGPRITPNGQIYKDYEKRKTVGGLYGAGNCVKSFAKHSYPASGVTISNAVFFGVKAGIHSMTSKNKL